MYTSCVLKSENGEFCDVVLSDGKSCHIGRCPETNIQDLKCSKRQLELTADFEQGTVHVVNTGSKDSEIKGRLLRTQESANLRNGDVLHVLRDKYKYTVVFESDDKPSTSRKRKVDDATESKQKQRKIEMNISSEDDEDDTKRVEESRQNLNQMKSSFTNFFKPKEADKSSNGIPGNTVSSTTYSWREVVPGKLFHFKTAGCQGSSMIAGFDVDGTIITTKSGRVFPTDISDWKILLPEIPSNLKKLVSGGYQIVFFTNQKGISRGKLKPEDFKDKLQGIAKTLSVPFQALVSSGSGLYRKPLRGMWDYFVDECNDNVKVDTSKCFYVGDAAGRPMNWEPKRKKDFSCSDRLFALNCQLKFSTPEEYFLKQKPAKYSLPTFDPKNQNGPLAVRIKPSEKEYSSDQICQPPEVIILVGFPGAGKSFFAQKYLVSKGYTHINRDTLGTHQSCQALCSSAIVRGSSVVVDNTNPDRVSRKRFIDIAEKHKLRCRCFLFCCDIDQAQHNIVFRELNGSDHAKVNIMVLNSYKSKFEEPELSEGFKEIVHINFVPSFKSEKDEKFYKMYLT